MNASSNDKSAARASVRPSASRRHVFARISIVGTGLLMQKNGSFFRNFDANIATEVRELEIYIPNSSEHFPRGNKLH